MVKIPGLDELKKMGTGLIDQAKAVKFGEMVDKVKSGIDSVSSGKKGPVEVSDEAIKNLFVGIFAGLTELNQVQAAQQNAIKNIQRQVEELAKVVQAYTVKPTAATAETGTASAAPTTPETGTASAAPTTPTPETQKEETKHE